MSDAKEQITDTLKTAAAKFRSLDEHFISAMLLCIIIFIICVAVWYIYSDSKLQKKECDYMNKMYGDVNGKISSICAKPEKCKDYLCNYYIKTAYNCCSGGSYKNDYVDICNLKAILKQGARCLDFEIYSVNGEPIVSTSTSNNYYVKETYNVVKFVDVMKIIDMYAFSDGAPNPADPIILHLRFKSNSQSMYKALVKILQKYNQRLLGAQHSYTNGENIGTKFKLSELANKIVLIADQDNTSFKENSDLTALINATSHSDNIRCFQYFQVKNPPDLEELENFNKGGFMTLVLPDFGMNPENPSANFARAMGCQMVAMRYQYVDNYLISDINFFNDCGYAFCIKADKDKYVPVVIPPAIPSDPANDPAREVDTPFGAIG
jgi:hypothetical protein